MTSAEQGPGTPGPAGESGGGRIAGLFRPFQEFFHLEASSGILLLAMALGALVWANSPLAGGYVGLWSTTVTVDVGLLEISKPLLLWINDGLMAIFFLVVGLEIKREILVGELSDPRSSLLAVAAAVGGMLIPAALYTMVNLGGPGEAGWGIPMATDIAFALGVLALLGSRVPTTLKVFVTAVAIVDDLGAVLVIALFYTAKLSLTALAVAGGFLAVLVALNRAGVHRTWPYAILGLGLWVAFLKSGVHATVAGVLLALTIPAKRRLDAQGFLTRAEELLERFREASTPGRDPSEDQQHAVHGLAEIAQGVETPLQRMEHALHPWVAFVIMPLFALANAGVAVGGDLGATLGSPITLGIVLGLVVGKQVGIVSLAWAATRAGLASLPEGVTWRQIWGVSLLSGIGFTMSLFIASLGLPDPVLLDQAKVGILVASLIAGVGGALILAGTGSTDDGEQAATG